MKTVMFASLEESKNCSKHPQANLSPRFQIEHALSKPNFIESAIVIAHKRKFTSCLFVPDFDVLKQIKTKKKLTNLSDEEFLNTPT